MGVLTLQFTKDALQGKPVKIKLLSMDQVSRGALVWLGWFDLVDGVA